MYMYTNDVYYKVKVQGNDNLARICLTQLTIKKLNTEIILKGAEVRYNVNRRSIETLKYH